MNVVFSSFLSVIIVLSFVWSAQALVIYDVRVNTDRYYQGTTIIVTYDIFHDTGFTDGFTVRIVSDSVAGKIACDDSATIPIRSYPVPQNVSKGTFAPFIAWDALGTFKAVLCWQAPPALYESKVFSIETNPIQILILDPNPVYQGGFLNMLFLNASQNDVNRLRVVSSDKVDADTYAGHVKDFTVYSESVLVDWGPPGLYKIVYIDGRLQTVMAISKAFEVQRNNASISFVKPIPRYYPGEKIDMTFNLTYPVKGGYTGFVFPVSLNSNYSNLESAVYSFDIYISFNYQDALSFFGRTITIDWSDVGYYKIVFTIKGETGYDVLGVSSPFEVVPNGTIIPSYTYSIDVDSTQYYQGTSLVITYVSINAVPFMDGDTIKIVSDSISGRDRCGETSTVRSYSVPKNDINGTLSTIITWNVLGTYKAVLCRVQDNPVLDESKSFSIEENPIKLSILNPERTFFQGGSMEILLPSSIFDNHFSTGIALVSSNKIENFTSDDILFTSTMYAPPYNKSVSIDWGPIGSYMLLYGEIYVSSYPMVLAVSDVFEVQPNNISITFGKEDKTYKKGENISLLFNSTYGIPFTSYRGYVVPASASGTNYLTSYVRSFYVSRYNLYNSAPVLMNSTSTILMTTIKADWSEYGVFKIVVGFGGIGVFYSNDSSNYIVLGESSPFEVVRNSSITTPYTYTISVDQTQYYQQTLITFTYVTDDEIPFRYDDRIFIVSESITGRDRCGEVEMETAIPVFQEKMGTSTSIVPWFVPHGLYKAVLCKYHSNPVLNESSVFKIDINPIRMVILNQKEYFFHGDYLNVSLTTFNDAAINYNNGSQLAVVSLYNIYNYTSQAILKSQYVYDSSQNQSIYIDWDSVGPFVIFYLNSTLNQVLAVSDEFVIRTSAPENKRVPTNKPVTVSPTQKPQTSVPTKKPITFAPTVKPQTRKPTNKPTNRPATGKPQARTPTRRPMRKPTKKPRSSTLPPVPAIFDNPLVNAIRRIFRIIFPGRMK